jgi:ATP-dependent protease ClpP protease subunit
MLTAFLNEVDNTQDLTIYINSRGGQTIIAEQIKHMLEAYPGKITVCALEIGSAAFFLFYSLKIKNKIIIPRSYGMCHHSSWGINVVAGGTPQHDIDRFIHDEMKDDTFIDDCHKLVKFTTRELKELKAGRDVFFNDKRLRTMLKYNKKQL